MLVSSTLDLYLTPVGRALGFDEVLCSRLAVAAGRRRRRRFTGELEGADCTGPEKLRRLMALARRPGTASNCTPMATARATANCSPPPTTRISGPSAERAPGSTRRRRLRHLQSPDGLAFPGSLASRRAQPHGAVRQPRADGLPAGGRAPARACGQGRPRRRERLAGPHPGAAAADAAHHAGRAVRGRRDGRRSRASCPTSTCASTRPTPPRWPATCSRAACRRCPSTATARWRPTSTGSRRTCAGIPPPTPNASSARRVAEAVSRANAQFAQVGEKVKKRDGAAVRPVPGAQEVVTLPPPGARRRRAAPA